MLRVGITGGIGCGKSEVCKILEKLGGKVIYADPIAKEMLDSDKDIQNHVIKLFGKGIYGPDGKVDRKQLAKKIFFDQNLKVKLEEIVHPYVINYIIQKFEEYENKYPIIFLEAALIYEAKIDRLLNYVIVVDSDPELCIQRVIKRDGTTREDVISRINSQMYSKKKLLLADFVIHNNSSLNELEKNVKFFYNLLMKISKTYAESKRT